MPNAVSSVFSSAFLAGVLTGFVPGFVSGYLLDRIRERRATRKERSKNIFEPLHAQLTRSHSQVADCERAHALDYNFWNQLQESGSIKAIPARLHRPLRELYSVLIPNYEAAWRAVNEQAVQALLEPWANRIGYVWNTGQIPRFPKWYKFLQSPQFQPSLLQLQDERIIPLWNKVTDEEKIGQIGLTISQFLEKLWNEAQTTPSFQSLRDSRLAALRRLSELILRIQKLIAH